MLTAQQQRLLDRLSRSGHSQLSEFSPDEIMDLKHLEDKYDYVRVMISYAYLTNKGYDKKRKLRLTRIKKTLSRAPKGKAQIRSFDWATKYSQDVEYLLGLLNDKWHTISSIFNSKRN